MLARRHANVTVQLLEDVSQGARKRAHAWRHREGKSMRMAAVGVRVLPEDDHAGTGEWASLKGGEGALCRRQHLRGAPLHIYEFLKLGKARLLQLLLQDASPRGLNRPWRRRRSRRHGPAGSRARPRRHHACRLERGASQRQREQRHTKHNFDARWMKDHRPTDDSTETGTEMSGRCSEMPNTSTPENRRNSSAVHAVSHASQPSHLINIKIFNSYNL